MKLRYLCLKEIQFHETDFMPGNLLEFRLITKLEGEAISGILEAWRLITYPLRSGKELLFHSVGAGPVLLSEIQESYSPWKESPNPDDEGDRILAEEGIFRMILERDDAILKKPTIQAYSDCLRAGHSGPFFGHRIPLFDLPREFLLCDWRADYKTAEWRSIHFPGAKGIREIEALSEALQALSQMNGANLGCSAIFTWPEVAGDGKRYLVCLYPGEMTGNEESFFRNTIHEIELFHGVAFNDSVLINHAILLYWRFLGIKASSGSTMGFREYLQGIAGADLFFDLGNPEDDPQEAGAEAETSGIPIGAYKTPRGGRKKIPLEENLPFYLRKLRGESIEALASDAHISASAMSKRLSRFAEKFDPSGQDKT